jgi:hypothetical protein
MNWDEDYANGHAADLRGFISPAPPWLLEVGWEYAGLWLTVTIKDLQQAIPGSTFVVQPSRLAYIEILPPPEQLGLMSLAYRDLEETSLPQILAGRTFFLTCSGAVMTLDKSSGFTLLGKFELVNGTINKPGEMRYLLGRRLVVAQQGEFCALPSQMSLTKRFSVSGVITGRPYDLDGPSLTRWEVGALVDVKQTSAKQKESLMHRLSQSKPKW